MKLRKPGRLSAADNTWIRKYQESKSAKVDGIIGRETLDHIKADLAPLQQPDDPGVRPGGDFKQIVHIAFAVGVITVIAVAAFLILG